MNRAAVAVPVNDLPFCSTCAGGLVAVDRISHEFRWAYRYPRDDTRIPGKPILASQSGSVKYENWNGWRRVEIHPVGDSRVLFVTPESHQVHCLDSRDGRIDWTCDTVNAQQFAGLNESHVFLMCADEIRVHAEKKCRKILLSKLTNLFPNLKEMQSFLLGCIRLHTITVWML